MKVAADIAAAVILADVGEDVKVPAAAPDTIVRTRKRREPREEAIAELPLIVPLLDDEIARMRAFLAKLDGRKPGS